MEIPSTSRDIATFDLQVPHLCQDACSQAFALYRKVNRVRAIFQFETSPEADGTSVNEVQSIFSLLDMFDSTIGLWLQRCFEVFPQLSTKSQLSAGQTNTHLFPLRLLTVT